MANKTFRPHGFSELLGSETSLLANSSGMQCSEQVSLPRHTWTAHIIKQSVTFRLEGDSAFL